MSAPVLSRPAIATRPPLSRTALGVVLLLLGAITFVVIDPVLAWDNANEWLGQGRLFLYFTTQSNLLAVAAYVVFGVAFVRGREPGTAAQYLRGLATIDMAITGIVNGLLLADPAAPWSFSEFVLHVGGPVVIVAWWIAMPAPRMSFSVVALWLVHPVLWTASVLTYASESSTQWVPYFFLDPAQMEGMAGVALYIAIIHVVIAALGAGAVALTRAPWSRRG